MDPNAALSALRDALTDVKTYTGDEATAKLAEVDALFDGLDQWLTEGGYLPTDWSRSLLQLAKKVQS